MRRPSGYGTVNKKYLIMNPFHALLSGAALAAVTLIVLPQNAEARDHDRGRSDRHWRGGHRGDHYRRWDGHYGHYGRHHWERRPHWRKVPRSACYVYRGRLICPQPRYYYAPAI